MIHTTKLLPTLLVTAALAAVPLGTAASAAEAPVHGLAVTGAGVTTYPAFSPATERYAATTTSSTGGALTITASTTDPAGRIYIDGVRDADGTATVTGLADGDEVPVFIDDAAGRAVHSVVYLPSDFPTLEVRTNKAGQSPGHVLITPNRYDRTSDTYEAAVDANGVPVFVHANREGYSSTFKPSGRGGYTVFRDTSVDSPEGSRLLELDAAFRPIREIRNVSVANTDAHDVVMRADGSRIMAGYEKQANGRVDNIIEEVDARGQLVFRWNTADHFNPVGPDLTGAARQDAIDKTDTMNPYYLDNDLNSGTMLFDYAHVDSLDLVDGGKNLLVSFRNTSSVVKIAWAADRSDGRARGDIIWRLGGRKSDFTFPNDSSYAGPCGQYSARQLANGNVLIFDNGSPAATSGLFADTALCPDPADPTDPAVGRTFTRVTEYKLDEAAGTATLVWDYKPVADSGKPDWYAFIAGGAEVLANGNYLISWGSARTQIVTEVVPSSKEVVWELRDSAAHGLAPFFSHRAVKAVVPDAISPTISLKAPADGSVLEPGSEVRVSHTCRDAGGSSLRDCTSTHADGVVDTSKSGPVTLTVKATDGAGNTTVETRSYTVRKPLGFVPDAAVRGKGKWVGNDDYAGSQRVVKRIRKGTKAFRARFQNDGDAAAVVTVRGSDSSKKFRVRYFMGKKQVTRRVVNKGIRTRLAPGEKVSVRVKVTRRDGTRAGAKQKIRMAIRSLAEPTTKDSVTMVAKARRR